MVGEEVDDSKNKDSVTLRKGWMREVAHILILCLFILVILIIWKHKNQQGSLNVSSLQTAQQSVSFTLYYPKPQSKYKLLPTSVNTSHGLAAFSYKYGQDLIDVSEQTQPPVIEQVTKTKQFTTSVGAAYLADLNGHTAGFIHAGRTLIVLSSANNVPDKLQIIMNNFQKLE